MFKAFPLLTLSATFALALASSACAPQSEPVGGDLALDDSVSGIGKADHLSMAFEQIDAHVSHEARVAGGHVIVTTAESFEEYFGTPAPDSVDFDTEWVAFFGIGTRNSGGYSANITGMSALPNWGGMVLETSEQQPGMDCLVTKAITWPYTLVKFEAPSPAPTWFAVDHETETYTCGPDEEDRLAELADSKASWELARDGANNSYTFTSEFHSFDGVDGRTTIVVDGGEVVERHYKQQHVSGGEATVWSEFGADIGSHDQGIRPVVIDELYAQCAEEILVKDDETHWIDFAVDFDTNLLSNCTATPKDCFDGCTSGPTIASITF